MIIYGTRLFGKVDTVPGLGHVATRFFHVDYLPLVPTQSWLVTSQTGNRWQGVKIPLSAKSIFVAWARAVSVAVGVAGIVGAVVIGFGRRPEPASIATMAVVSAAGWGFFAFTRVHRMFKRANYARACQLAKLARMDDPGLAALAAAYGEAPPAFGFAPVVRAPAVAVPVNPPQAPAAVELLDEPPADDAPIADDPPAVTAAKPLRGY